MKKIRYSKEQIVRILRETARDTIPDVAKWHGVSEASIYPIDDWRNHYNMVRPHSSLAYKILIELSSGSILL